jgi:ribonuclease HII
MGIVGVDEVGRGCWAGPVVVGAVLLSSRIDGLDDSKLLSRHKRVALTEQIYKKAEAVGLGWASQQVIDEQGLTLAIRLAMIQALEAITCTYDCIIIDGSYNFLADNPRAVAIVRADHSVPAVSAASVVAKVARDSYMCDAAIQYPGYGFDKHVGYGTLLHRQQLSKRGICALHRRSFKPISALL